MARWPSFVNSSANSCPRSRPAARGRGGNVSAALGAGWRTFVGCIRQTGWLIVSLGVAEPALAATPASILLNNPRAISVGTFVTLAPRPAPGTHLSYAPVADQTSDALFEAIADHGGGFVRLLTNPLPLLDDDQATRSAAIAQILQLVDKINGHGLGVIVDVHHWPPGNPGQQTAALVSSPIGRGQLARGLVELARQLKTRPEGEVGLELLNEPACRLMANVDWPKVEGGIYDDIRQAAPTLPLVLTGCNGLPDDLMKMDVSHYRNDPNAIFTLHFYEPFIFTHQLTYYGGASFRRVPFPPRVDGGSLPLALAQHIPLGTAANSPNALNDLGVYLRGLGVPQDENNIAARMHTFGAWADRNGIARSRIFVGEFGVNIGARDDDGEAIWPDVLRWLQAVTTAIQREGFAYAVWPPARPHGYFTDPATGFIRDDALRAIGWRVTD